MILSDLPPAEQTLSYAARSTQTRRPCVKLAFIAGFLTSSIAWKYPAPRTSPMIGKSPHPRSSGQA